MILVTGATGFIGRHTVATLLDKGNRVIAVDRDASRLPHMPWTKEVEFIECDLYQDYSAILDRIPECRAVIHLAWAGLPNFKATFHLTQNLPADIKFLNATIDAGIKHLLVAGTCLEYGMQNGPLSEEMPSCPVTSYGLAKDCMRKTLEKIIEDKGVILQWLRIFYPYGSGQNPKSLLAALEKAIDEGQSTFNMSYGEQLRDYIHVDEIASIIAFLMNKPECAGVINCCSGQPISIRRLVEEYCKQRNAKIELNLGYYPYPDYEPLAFWGVPGKLREHGYNNCSEEKCL